jgi:hypothetical protein
MPTGEHNWTAGPLDRQTQGSMVPIVCDLGAVHVGGRMPPHVGHERGQIRA